MASPTTQQLLIAIAALARGFELPSITGNQTGIRRGPANTLDIPISNINPQGLYNQQLGANVSIKISAEGNFLQIGLNEGDVSSGL